MLKRNFCQLRVVFISFMILCFFNDWVFPITTAYCIEGPGQASPGSDPDAIIIPGNVVRAVKAAAPVVWLSTKDGLVVAGVAAATKSAPPVVRAGIIISVYSANKLAEFAHHAHSKHAVVEKAKSSASPTSNIEIPSIVEYDWLSNLMSNMSDIQIIATCCAGFICLSLVTMTVLVAWTIAREFADKAKSIMVNYPKLNKIFLFYLKWGDLASIPARIIFVFLSFMHLTLCVYFLSLLLEFY